MLDLQILQNKTYDLKWIDGSELNLKKLSKSQIFLVGDLDVEIGKEKDMKKQLDLVTKRLLLILNNNINEIKFTSKDVDKLSIDLIALLTEDYMKFINEASKNPN